LSLLREVAFDKAAFSLDVLKKGAYRFIDQFSTEFRNEEKVYTCVLRFGPNKSDESAERAVEEFRKEVLDQDLRASIKAETEPIRNLILAHAFSKTSLVNNE
jgi:His-Xaa-Ser system protein HxsD